MHIFHYVSGAAEGTRTPDPIITNDVLYQLSYSGALDASAVLSGHGAFVKPQWHALEKFALNPPVAV